jgi:hypothetical protein
MDSAAIMPRNAYCEITFQILPTSDLRSRLAIFQRCAVRFEFIEGFQNKMDRIEPQLIELPVHDP